MSKAAATDGSTNSQNSPQIISRRLVDVKGDRDKTNDVFVYGDRNNRQHVIYFGGDVQNYPENMEGDNARHVQWNTENTAALLYHKFPASLVLVIKAKEMHLDTFSVYSNFVEVNEFGGPIHCSMYGASKHLTLLYKSALRMIKEIFGKQSCDGKSSHGCSETVTERRKIEGKAGPEKVEEKACQASDPSLPISLIGFSKGCVVLNQLVFELQSDRDAEVTDFLSRVCDVYWLDGGHNGGHIDLSNHHTYVTEPRLVKLLSELGCGIHVHVTPYQVEDPQRPWLGKHYRRFCQLLRSSGASFHGRMHFEQEPASLENHFKVLETFKT